MAGRALARLRAKQEAAVQEASPEGDASEEEEITPVASRSSAPFNPYELLDDEEVTISDLVSDPIWTAHIPGGVPSVPGTRAACFVCFYTIP